MVGDQFNINLWVSFKDESFGINIPPVSTLIFNKITDQLFEGNFEMNLKELTNTLDIPNCFFEILLTGALYCIERLWHFRIDHKFTDLINFFPRCVGIV